MHDIDLSNMVEELGGALRARGWMLATAESCTGGLVGHMLTNVSGSSDWFAGGLVAYSNLLKQELLGVPEEVLSSRGAVSQECVEAMARGVCGLIGSDVGIAVSGVAGPTGGSPEKPVGTVWIAWHTPEGAASHVFHMEGNRRDVKTGSAQAAISGLRDMLIPREEPARPQPGESRLPEGVVGELPDALGEASDLDAPMDDGETGQGGGQEG